MDDLPYRAEYAKTGKAGCKNCKDKIDQGTLRIAAMVQSYHHDGKDPHWFHGERCFFEKHRPKSTDEIDHFENIRYEDQQMIRQKVEELGGLLLPTLRNEKKPEAFNLALKDFGVEYSVSSRAECVGCQNKIMKEDIRVKRVVYDTEVGIKYGGQPMWHHLDCFACIRGDYGYYLGGKSLPGFRDLASADKKVVKKAIPPIKLTETQVKKLKADPKDEDVALEETIKKQSMQLFKIRDGLQSSCDKLTLQNILFENNSGMVEGNDNLLDRCADFLTFGALAKCQKCMKGDMIFAKGGYRCNGTSNESAVCGHFVEKPPRVKCKLPSELLKKEKGNFFSKYKSKVEDRVLRPCISDAEKKLNKSAEIGEAKVQRAREPLYRMKVVAIGELSTPKQELRRRIEKMGGKLQTELHGKIAVVISNADEVDKMDKQMQEVEKLQIQVVSEDFLDAIAKGSPNDTIQKIKSMAICEWGSDPLSRMPDEEAKGPKESIYSRNWANVVDSMNFKNGIAFYRESARYRWQVSAHVFRLGQTLYTSVLCYCDIQKNKNSYYKLHVLQSNDGRMFWLFREWGRIGTRVGDSKIEQFSTPESACEEFERLYEEKTGNVFNSGIRCKKVLDRYVPVEVHYDDDSKAKQIEKSSISSKLSSKLPKATQDLVVQMLFDVKAMKQTIMEFGLGLEKMPLGRLSKNQLHDACQTLSELNDLLTRGDNSNSELIALSNKFFTLVPHNFGMNRAPVIDTLEMIQNKREILDNLIDVKIAYLQQDSDDELDLLDAHYDELKAELELIDHKAEEFTLIDERIQNTHAATHDEYSVELTNDSKVTRHREKHRPNLLLWLEGSFTKVGRFIRAACSHCIKCVR